jgi:hypothetical protein
MLFLFIELYLNTISEKAKGGAVAYFWHISVDKCTDDLA